MKKLLALLFAAGLLSLAVGCPPGTTSSTTRSTTTGPLGPINTSHMGGMGSEKTTEKSGSGGTEKTTEKAGPAGTEKSTEKAGKDTKR